MCGFSRDAAILIVANAAKDAGLEYAGQIKEYLGRFSADAAIITTTELSDSGAPPAHSGLWVVLGGDGTMLAAAHHAACVGAAMYGINLGNVGHLTDASRADGLLGLRQIMEGRGCLRECMMLSADFPGPSAAVPQHLALNEAVLHGCGALVDFCVYINNQHVCKTRADGILVCTPTGSTAYNRSAGGPALFSQNLLSITPICPIDAGTQSIVTAGGVVGIIAQQPVRLFLDGVMRRDLPPGRVDIAVSPHSAKIYFTHHSKNTG